jgi:hypothetical protein
MPNEVTAEQRARIKKYLPIFKKYLESPQAKADQKMREEKTHFFQALNKAELLSMDEAKVKTLIANLWATQFWKNQQYILEKIIANNGLDKLRTDLSELLWDNCSIGERYSRFLKKIKGLGPASVTEMLSMAHPDECGIWNDKARKALVILGFSDALPVNKYKISGKELEQFNNVYKAIAEELQSNGFGKTDLLDVNCFLYEVTLEVPTKEIIIRADNVDFDHDEICEHIRDIGLWLGFEAEMELKISTGAQVDVMWRAQIGNLGVVTYIFEVQRGGSIDSLILNLQKAKANPTVQKVVAVANAKQLEKIAGEVHGLAQDFVNSLALWQVNDVETVYENLSEAMSVIKRLELVKDMFPLSKSNSD